MNGWKVSAPKTLIRTTPEGTLAYRLRRSRIFNRQRRLPQSLGSTRLDAAARCLLTTHARERSALR